MNLTCHNSILYINLKTLSENVNKIKSKLGQTSLIAVIKSNAYGTGALKISKWLIEKNNISKFAVSQISEAIYLRENKISDVDILVLGSTFPEYFHKALEHNITLTVFDVLSLKKLNTISKEIGKIANIHIKINTGLNRLGLNPNELDLFLDELKKSKNINVTGVFTHFADIEMLGDSLLNEQLNIFKSAVEKIKSQGFKNIISHASGSGAFEKFEKANLDAVRIGRRLYMENPISPLPSTSPYHVEEIMSWRSKIMYIREIKENEAFGYSRTKALKNTRLALVGVGYGDGLYPLLGEVKAPVLVNGKICKILDICMDQCFIDISDIDCNVEDEVTFFGYSKTGAFLSSQEISVLVNQEGVNLTSQMSDRVKREYIYE